jgi:hypothetical protein
MTSNDVLETAVVLLGAGNLAGWRLIATDKLRTPNRRPVSTTQKPPAEVTADASPVTLSGPWRPARAVARSTANPGLAAVAAARPRNEHGQFIPTRRAS